MQGRIYDAFDSIKASEKLKSSTRQRIQAEAEKRKKSVFHARLVLSACAALCLMLGLGGWYGVNSYPVSYVSIDVNPSIELSLNYWDKVIRASAYNEDGEKILDTLSVKGMHLEGAVETILECDAMAQYLTADAELAFTIAAGSPAKEEKICEVITSSSCCHTHTAYSYSASIDSIAEAHDNGMSFGKYAAYLQLYGYDDTVTISDCQDMTMSEIHGLIHEHEQEHGTSGQGHGSGGEGQEHGQTGREHGTHGHYGD